MPESIRWTVTWDDINENQVNAYVKKLNADYLQLIA